MEWLTLAQSSDPNPTENSWDDINNAVYEAKARNASEFWNIVRESWSRITAERCHK